LALPKQRNAGFSNITNILAGGEFEDGFGVAGPILATTDSRPFVSVTSDPPARPSIQMAVEISRGHVRSIMRWRSVLCSHGPVNNDSFVGCSG
jgi:hypothetical protein